MKLRHDNLTWNVVGDEVVVLDLEGSVYLSLNGSARLLWERLAEGSERTELTSVLVAEYRISTDRAERDVDEFLEELDQRRLLDAPQRSGQER